MGVRSLVCGLVGILLTVSPGWAALLLDRGDETVIDQQSGLIWQQAEAGRMSWQEAVRFCNNLDLAGLRGWRLPFREELQSLQQRADGAQLKQLFPQQQADVYWSLSREEHQPDQVWGVSFADGKPYRFNRRQFTFPARCLVETEVAVYMPLLTKWASAWSAQDVERYLACYSRDFVAEGGRSRQQWAALRRQRLTKPARIEVALADVKLIGEEKNRAEIMFRQSYRSDNYRDQVLKVLTLGLEDGTLVIISERTISKLD